MRGDQIVHRRLHAALLVRDAGERERHLGEAERADQRAIVDVAEMADAEDLAGDLAEAGAERDVVLLQRDLAEAVGVMARRHQDAGQHGRLLGRVLAEHFESPGLDRGAAGAGKALMAGKDVVEPFLVQHGDAFGEAVQHLRRRRVGEEADLVHVEHVVPRPERLGELRRLRRRQRLVAHGVERHAGRHHQSLLRPAHGHVDAPLVVAIVGRGERGDGVDEQQRRMAGRVHRLANVRDRGETAGRGLVVQHADRLDLLVGVLAQMLLDRRRIGAHAPVGLDELGLEAELLRHVLPQRGELAGLHHQHAVAGRERVDQRRFPGAGARRGIGDYRIGGLENGLDAVEALLRELGEFRPAVVDHRGVHRPQHAVGQRGRSRNLQEVASNRTRGVLRHQQVLVGTVFFGNERGWPGPAATGRHEGRKRRSVKGFGDA